MAIGRVAWIVHSVDAEEWNEGLFGDEDAV